MKNISGYEAVKLGIHESTRYILNSIELRSNDILVNQESRIEKKAEMIEQAIQRSADVIQNFEFFMCDNIIVENTK